MNPSKPLANRQLLTHVVLLAFSSADHGYPRGRTVWSGERANMEDPMNAPDTVRQAASEPQGPTNRGAIRRVDDLEILGPPHTNATILLPAVPHATSHPPR